MNLSLYAYAVIVVLTLLGCSQSTQSDSQVPDPLPQKPGDPKSDDQEPKSGGGEKPEGPIKVKVCEKIAGSSAMVFSWFGGQGGNCEASWFTKNRSYDLSMAKIFPPQSMPSPTTTYSVGKNISSSPVVLKDNTIFVSATDGTFYWLKNGSTVAQVWTGCAINTTPAVLADGTIVSGCNKGRVIWVRNGKIQQSLDFGEAGSYLNSPVAILSDGTVVLGTEKKFFWVKDGKVLSKFETGESLSQYPASNGAAAVLDDDTIVAGSSDGNIYWLKNGVEVSKFSTGFPIRSAPVVLSDSTIVIGAGKNVLWLKNAIQQFQFQVEGGNVPTTPSIVSSDGTILIGDDYGVLYWLRDGALTRKVKVTYKKPNSENTYAAEFYASMISFNPEVAVASGWQSELIWTHAGAVNHRQTTNNTDKTPAFMSDGAIVTVESNKVFVYR